ncbi:MAG: di-heme enzyme [Nevskiales bacterium]|nr:di-heme enzyme [Nevskiales bacterium]
MGASLALAACGGDDGDLALPAVTPSGYTFDLPSGFPLPRIPADNPMSTAKVDLGRTLFYDKRTSVNEGGSCASCHEQRRAFTDGRSTAIGPTGDVHPRAAMSLTNVVYNARQNWFNPNIEDLRQQALGVMLNENTIELGWAGREQMMLDRLRADPAYVDAFAAAFPDETDPFTLDNVAKAYAAFVATLISGRSAYDRYYDPQAPDPGAMNAAARRGEALFFSERLECFHCHGGFNFAQSVNHAGTPLDGIEYRNNGLYNIAGPAPGLPLTAGNYPADNQGLYEFTQVPSDMGRFRAPTLRNIALTAPYMHDGSIPTLRQVLTEHYARGGRLIASGARAGDGAQNPHKDALMVGFSLNAQEVDDVLAFLDSLTDWAFVCDPRFSDPSGSIPMHERCATAP